METSGFVKLLIKTRVILSVVDVQCVPRRGDMLDDTIRQLDTGAAHGVGAVAIVERRWKIKDLGECDGLEKEKLQIYHPSKVT